jgi:hypothetical protein
VVAVSADKYETKTETLSLEHGEKKTVVLSLIREFGTMYVVSTPLGADMYLNDTLVGKTPYRNTEVLPSNYRVKLVMPGYEDVLANVMVEKDRENRLNYTLKHTQSYLDSVAAAKREVTRKRQFYQKIVFGALGIGCGVAAEYMDWQAMKKRDEQDRIYQNYKNAPQGTDFSAYKQNYSRAGTDADTYMHKRNILFTLTGGCAVGVGLAFVF